MSKIKIAMFGASGKMGKEILHIAEGSGVFVPSFAFSRKSKSISGWNLTLNKIKDKKIEALRLDLCVDFSLPEANSLAIEFCLKNKLPLICGTTGLSEIDFVNLKKLGKTVPVLWASNMSLGIAVVHRLLEQFSVLNGFDFQIEELHHKKKKDRPSGTAISLQKTLNKVTSKKNPEPASIRGGGIFGIHKIYAMSEEEIISIEHTALNRAVFAKGALTAGKWLMQQKPGLYSIDDMFKN